MKLHDLVTIHYFHDCILNNIQYDSIQRRLEISLDFCKWMQEYYVEGMPDVIAVKLVFTNVSRYFDDELGEVDSMYYEILDGDPILDESGAPVIDDAGNMGVSFFIDRGFEENNRSKSKRPSIIEIFAQNVEFIDMGPVVDED
ncbi:MAG: hypothetical protein IKX40_13360 [Thermoguttaceae bacterium]|nr:hypothetical protein [Thermoguttaceae bacterium]